MSEITKQLSPDFEVMTTHRGEEVKVHSVPTILINSIKTDTPKPKRPQVEMKIKTGSQKRWAKAGDPEWDEYQAQLEAWKEEQDELTNAVTAVLALRSYQIGNSTLLKIPASQLQFPDYVQDLIAMGVVEIPVNEWKLKSMWLSTVVISQQDELEISWILQRLGGVPEDLIEQMKANFRNSVYGKAIVS